MVVCACKDTVVWANSFEHVNIGFVGEAAYPDHFHWIDILSLRLTRGEGVVFREWSGLERKLIWVAFSWPVIIFYSYERGAESCVEL